MTRKTRMILVAALELLGLGLIIGGIVADKNGAVVVGMCTAAAAAQQLIVMRRQVR